MKEENWAYVGSQCHHAHLREEEGKEIDMFNLVDELWKTGKYMFFLFFLNYEYAE